MSLRLFTKKFLAITAVIALGFPTIFPVHAADTATWGPQNIEPHQSGLSYANPAQAVGYDSPTFNNFTDLNVGPFSDERQFLVASNYSQSTDYSDNTTLAPLEIIKFRGIIHNNGKEGVATTTAQNTRFRFSGFSEVDGKYVTDTFTEAKAFRLTISADNATPGEVFDETLITPAAGKEIRLRYYPNNVFLLTSNQPYVTKNIEDPANLLGSTGALIGSRNHIDPPNGNFEAGSEVMYTDIYFIAEAVVADLQIGKIADKPSANIGDTVTFTLDYQNKYNATEGGIETSAQITDSYDTNIFDASTLSFNTPTGVACSDNNGAITCDIDNIDYKETQTITYNIEAQNTGTQNTSADIASANGVTDGDNTNNTSSTVQVEISQGNQAPTAVITETPASANELTQITANSNTSSDPDGSIASQQWTISGDCTLDAGSNNTDQSININLNDVDPAGGTCDIDLEVTDNEGETGTTSTSVTINDIVNQAPTVTIDNEPILQITHGDPVNNLSSTVNDENVGTVTYQWTTNASCEASGSNTNDTANINTGLATGTPCEVTLTVTDEHGATGNDTVEIFFIPTIEISGPDVVAELDTKNTYSSLSVDPDGGNLIETWSVAGACTLNDQSPSVTFHETPHTGGTCELTLEITDDEATPITLSTVKTIDIWDRNNNPKFDDILINNVSHDPKNTIEHIETNGGQNISLEVQASDFHGDALTYEWIVVSATDGGNPIDGATYGYTSATDTAISSFQAEKKGEYVLRITVEDTEGLNPTREITIIVENDQAISNQAPVSTISAPNDLSEHAEGSTVTIDGSTSSDPDGNITDYTWSSSDQSICPLPSPANTDTINITFPNIAIDNQACDITLTVTDNDGLINSTKITLIVRSDNPIQAVDYTGTADTWDWEHAICPNNNQEIDYNLEANEKSGKITGGKQNKTDPAEKGLNTILAIKSGNASIDGTDVKIINFDASQILQTNTGIANGVNTIGDIMGNDGSVDEFTVRFFKSVNCVPPPGKW